MSFSSGKAPFIFSRDAFVDGIITPLQDSITNTLDRDKLDVFARQSGFLQRRSKLKPDEFIDTLMFSGLDHGQLSLQDCCNDLARQHQTALSKVALHKRFNSKSLNFLKLVLAEQLSSRLNIKGTDDWQPFSRVVIADSCKFSLPAQCKDDYPGFTNFGNVSSIMNIQYAFDIKNGDWENLELTRATENDQSHSKKTLHRIGRGELHICDLGFVTPSYLRKVVSEQAFFLNRLHPQWKPLQHGSGKPVDWAALHQKMNRSGKLQFETMVTIGTGEDGFNCRLIAVPVPEQVWAERIRIAQQRAKSQKVALSDEYKSRCRFSIFITNTPITTLKAAEVIQLYRLRWQIELVFKTWKSLLAIHKVRAARTERLECQLVAKFIWIFINWKIFRFVDSVIRKNQPAYALSIWKFFKHTRLNSQVIRSVVAGELPLKDWWERFLFPIIKSLLIEPKKGKKAAFEIVYEVFKNLS
ncbi:IS4 family transposase [Mucilaginibacter mali]|uniref:IS4 family transposase n=1 Tax=Mucilaginibacter mali TaxID=2740462 RepID=A0A7D4UFN1_9SPHI|nr:IS4 family transposase [Mucilaginibacter mali]QKJ30596.1 IS4 family transposase [Mucilaginibacter mali]